MDTRIYEKGARADALWPLSVGVLIALAIFWMTGA